MMMRCHTQDKMVHLVASLDDSMFKYINKMLERGEGRGEGRGERGEGRGESGEWRVESGEWRVESGERRKGRERSSDGDMEGRFTSKEQGLRVD